MGFVPPIKFSLGGPGWGCRRDEESTTEKVRLTGLINYTRVSGGAALSQARQSSSLTEENVQLTRGSLKTRDRRGLSWIAPESFFTVDLLQV